MNTTTLIIASVVIVSLLAWSSKSLRHTLVLNPFLVRQRGHVHRLLTAGWIHADGQHLIFNMLTLYFFANVVEQKLGSVKLVLLYVSAVVVAFVPTTLRYMKNPAYNSLGASGAVAAMVFSAILMVPGLRLGLMFVPVQVPGLLYAAAYLAYSAWHSYRSRDGINHDAHFSGAIYGALITFAIRPDLVQRTLRAYF